MRVGLELDCRRVTDIILLLMHVCVRRQWSGGSGWGSWMSVRSE
jgi:hypothetical protein